MKTYLDCVPCFLRQSLEAARIVSQDVQLHERTVREVLRLAAELDLGESPPFVAQRIHRRLRELTGAEDPYRSAKTRFNRMAMDALPRLAELVQESEDPLLAAAKLAVVANAIDMGVSSSITDDDVRRALCGASAVETFGDWVAFRAAAAKAEHILYLTDNAGEIAVDRLAIEQLGPHRVTVAVRGTPVLNDATMDDAREVRMHELVEVIDNGSDAPGTILADCSESFRRRFERAQLIIAKGQGNFETLSGVASNIAFWFKVKCPVVSSSIGVPLGTHALLAPGEESSVRGAAPR